MDNETVNPEDGIQFARDMRRVREFHGLTILDVFESTRIPEGVLQAFESTALFGHPTFNRVYLRSVVRSYAAAVRIPEADALDALEQALIGMYHGELAKRFASQESASPAKHSQSNSDALVDHASESDVAPDRKRARRIQSSNSVGNKTADKEVAAEATPHKPARATVTISSAPDPADLAAAASAAAQAPAAGVVVRPSMVRRSILLLAIAVVAIAVVWIALQQLRGTSPPEDVLQSSGTSVQQAPSAEPVPGVLVSDTLALSSTGGIAAVAEGGLGDSIAASIRSLGLPVREIRIRIDSGLRRPYWIERDSAITLRFSDRLIVEDHNGRVTVDVPAVDSRSGSLTPGSAFVLSRRRLDRFLEAQVERKDGRP